MALKIKFSSVKDVIILDLLEKKCIDHSKYPLWRHVQKSNFTQVASLATYLELPDALKKQLLLRSAFPLNLPQRLAKKIKKGTLDDPILLQFMPLECECLKVKGFVKEPLMEGSCFCKTKKLLHKYQGRALLIVTKACAVHCRFCFRRHFLYETETVGFDEEIAYLKQDESLTEVVLSGGDPLSLSDEALNSLFLAMHSIPHLRRIRFHTRFPVGIPERITDELLAVLRACSKQIIFVIHCNHPHELDCDVVASLKKIQLLGIPVLSQSVLLRGVNDDPEIFLNLCETCINAGILPYYLHILDQVDGAAHFSLPPAKGLELIQYVQERLSGFGVPKLVQEIPHQLCKVEVKNNF